MKMGTGKLPTGRMCRMVIKYSKDSLKFLSKLDSKSIDRIRTAIHGLTQTPPKGDIKAMQGYSDNRKRLRVGSWRVIYRYGVENEIEILFILDIGNRGDIYKRGGSDMSDMAIDAARLMDMLPDEDKSFAYEFIKKLVKAWDPDFTKVTPEEARRIEAAEQSGFIAEDDIDWSNLGAALQ